MISVAHEKSSPNDVQTGKERIQTTNKMVIPEPISQWTLGTRLSVQSSIALSQSPNVSQNNFCFELDIQNGATVRWCASSASKTCHIPAVFVDPPAAFSSHFDGEP
jgi:hypothetical protein